MVAQQTGTRAPAHQQLAEGAVRKLLDEHGARAAPRMQSLARCYGRGSAPELVGLSSNLHSGTLDMFPLCLLEAAHQPLQVACVTRCPILWNLHEVHTKRGDCCHPEG